MSKPKRKPLDPLANTKAAIAANERERCIERAKDVLAIAEMIRQQERQSVA
jgi:hypothetical protein